MLFASLPGVVLNTQGLMSELYIDRSYKYIVVGSIGFQNSRTSPIAHTVRPSTGIKQTYSSGIDDARELGRSLDYCTIIYKLSCNAS